MERIAIRFKTTQGIYTAGEIAAFNPERAKRYLDGGVAERVDVKPTKKGKADDPDPASHDGLETDDGVDPPESRKPARNRMIDTSGRPGKRAR